MEARVIFIKIPLTITSLGLIVNVLMDSKEKSVKKNGKVNKFIFYLDYRVNLNVRYL